MAVVYNNFNEVKTIQNLTRQIKDKVKLENKVKSVNIKEYKDDWGALFLVIISFFPFEINKQDKQ